MVVDGRQPGVSAGASIPQMASILKNLGCEEALNFDGGGSTQLATPDTFINVPSESFRSVPSVWSIFKKANLETPVPTTPADQSSTDNNPIQLIWNMPNDIGTTYRLQIATSKDNWNKQVGFTPGITTNSTVLVNEDLTIAHYNFTNLTLGNTYYWSVIAYKTGDFKSYYSEPISFTYTNGIEVDWKKSDSNSKKSTWFGTNSERGLAYANNKVYVVSRNGGKKVKILDSFNGTDLGELSVSGISGGTFAFNDIEASTNGMLLACNLTINTGTSNFKIYKWANDSTKPEVFIDYTSPSNIRLGDKFTVMGDISTNAAIYAAAGAGTKVVRWIIVNGAIQSTAEITLPAAMGNQPSVTALETSADSDIIVNSIVKSTILYSSTGVDKGTLGSPFIDSDSNAIKYFELDGKKYLAIF